MRFCKKNFAFALILALAVLGLPMVAAEGARNLYLGLPYISHPLGEGENAPYTDGPLYRFDGFDCVTYVETVLAEAKGAANFDENMKLIRYIDGEVDFFTRAHFTEYQWIPNAIKHGFISRYPLPNEAVSRLEIDHAEWFLKNPTVKNLNENFKAQANAFPPFKSSIPFIPRGKINKNLLAKLDDNMVAFILKKYDKPVMPGQIGSAILVSHMGLLLNKTQLYHASSVKEEIVSLPILEYIKNDKNIYGIAFYKIEK